MGPGPRDRAISNSSDMVHYVHAYSLGRALDTNNYLLEFGDSSRYQQGGKQAQSADFSPKCNLREERSELLIRKRLNKIT